MPAPFVKTVRTRRNWYAYDVNSGRLLRVPAAVGGVLAEWEKSPGRAQPRKAEDRRALGFIRELQRTAGLFSTRRPERLRPNLAPGDCAAAESRRCAHFILSVTEACNFRCRYCVYSGRYPARRRHSTRIMPWDVARRAIDLLAETARQTGEEVYLGFYGGEPLLRFDFIRRCVAYADRRLGRRAHRFSLTTNASLLSDRIADFLVEHRFIVTVSLDGPRAVHDRNRRFAAGGGTFADVTAGVERLRRRMGAESFGSQVILNSVLTLPYDLRQLQRFFARYPSWLRLSSPEYGAGRRARAGADGVRGAAAMARAMRDYCLDRARAKDFRLAGVSLPFECYHRELRRLHGRPQGPMREPAEVLGLCQPGRTRAFVSAAGKLYVCERVEDNDNMVIGSVERGIDPARVAAILDAAAGLDFSRCRDCWLVRICSMCFAHLVHDGRLSEEKWRRSCQARRRHYADALRLYCQIMEKDESALDFLDEGPSPVA